MQNLEEEIIKKKRILDEAKTSKATLEGRIQVQKERLQELGCNSVEDAKKKSAELKKQAEKTEREVEKSLQEFEKKYGF